MKKIILASAAMVLLTSLQAQEKNSQPKKKKEVVEEKVIEKKVDKNGKKSTNKTITINLNSDGKEEKTVTIDVDKNGVKEKNVIIVEDNKVTLNGKPIEDLSDSEMEVLIDNGVHLGDIAPRIRINRSLGKMRRLAPEVIREYRLNMGNNKALLGVSSKTVNEGAEIISVNKESAAEKAGLKEGDIITKVNDQEVTKEQNLYKVIGGFKPEDKVSISYLRDGKKQVTEAILEKNKEENSRVIEMDGNGFMEMPFGEMGEKFPFVEGFPLNEERVIKYRASRPKLGVKIQDVEDGDGVKILNVEENSTAQKAGILVTDIIVKIGDTEIKSVDDFRRQTNSLKEGQTINVTVNRNGKQELLTIKYPKKLKTAEL